MTRQEQTVLKMTLSV